MKNLARVTILAAVAASLQVAYAATPAYILTATQSSDRPAADAQRDATRHPADLIAFAGLKPGDTIADIMPGGGYFTRIFANVVGPKGHVYATIPSEFLAVKANAADSIKSLAAETSFGNVTTVVSPTAQIGTGETLDMAWTSDNYHDIYGFFGPQQAASMDASVFKALKPGGVFIVIDHVAPAGTSDTSPKTLHRIDPETVKAQVEAAGFKLEAQSDILKNAADPHTAKVFAPEIRGKTDQFVFKFRKPAQ
jgi:predicted methyltransferase